VWENDAPQGEVTVGPLPSGLLEPLRSALYEAAFWRGAAPPDLSFDAILSDPHLALYIDDWGRAGDTAVVARDSTGAIGGAAWFRFFAETSHGYGFVNDATPEVSIGVQQLWRGLGVGTRLLEALHAGAKAAAIPRLSLSVEPDNPALHLYRRMGYAELTRDSGAMTMLIELDH
jgi:GNAT superfamily N-acetyltransferase